MTIIWCLITFHVFLLHQASTKMIRLVVKKKCWLLYDMKKKTLIINSSKESYVLFMDYLVHRAVSKTIKTMNNKWMLRRWGN